MSNKIYADDKLYSFARPLVDFFIHRSYKRNIIRGLENIPADGEVIFAPNHCNTLMDALVVLASRREKTVFGARADIFKKPAVAKIMHWLRILPMVRSRDGLKNVLQNYETIDQIVEVLDNHVKFCLYAEGTHRMKHSLLPIGKGIYRIALKAHETFGAERPVYIVPVGLEYGDYRRYRSTSIVNFGKAVNISAWLEEHKELGEADAFRAFREMLSGRMGELITYIKDDGNYEPKWTLTKTSSAGVCGAWKRLESNQAAVARIEQALEQQPEESAALFEKARNFEKHRLAAKVSFRSFGHKHLGLRVIFRTLAALLTNSYFNYCAIMSAPMWATSILLCKKVFKDKAFWNTGRFGVNLAMSLIMPLIWALPLFLCLDWMYALPLFIMALPSYAVTFQYAEYVRTLVSDYRLLFNAGLRKEFDSLRTELEK